MNHTKKLSLLLLATACTGFAMNNSSLNSSMQTQESQSSLGQSGLNQSHTQPPQQDLLTSQQPTTVYVQEPTTRFIRILNWLTQKLENRRDAAIQNELEKTRKQEQKKLAQQNEKELAQLVGHSKVTPIVSAAMLAGNLGFAWFGKNKHDKEKTFYPGALIGGSLCAWSLCRYFRNQHTIKEYAKLKTAHLQSPLQPTQATIATLEHVKKMLERNKKSSSWVKNGNKLGIASSILGLGATIP